MTLETVSGALLLFYILLIPLVIFAVAMIAYSFQYWREKRKEEFCCDALEKYGHCACESFNDKEEGE